VSSVEIAEKVVKNLMFLWPKFGEASHFFLGGGLPTYWTSLVEIPRLVFHLCWRIKKSAAKYNRGLAFGGHSECPSSNGPVGWCLA